MEKIYFALLDTGAIVKLGLFESFCHAADYCDTQHGNNVWIFDAETAKQWHATLSGLIDTQGA